MNELAQQTQHISYRLESVSEITGVSVSKLRKDIRTGTLRAKKLGGCVIVLRADLDSYLAKAIDYVEVER